MIDIKMCRRFETHSHSHYSNIRLLDSINRPKDMILTAYKLGLSGICLTDHEALCGHVEFLQLEKSLKEKGKIPEDFKIGLGNEIYLTDDRRKSQKYFHFILIAKDTEGHRQLRELSELNKILVDPIDFSKANYVREFEKKRTVDYLSKVLEE